MFSILERNSIHRVYYTYQRIHLSLSDHDNSIPHNLPDYFHLKFYHKIIPGSYIYIYIFELLLTFMMKFKNITLFI